MKRRITPAKLLLLILPLAMVGCAEEATVGEICAIASDCSSGEVCSPAELKCAMDCTLEGNACDDTLSCVGAEASAGSADSISTMDDAVAAATDAVADLEASAPVPVLNYIGSCVDACSSDADCTADGEKCVALTEYADVSMCELVVDCTAGSCGTGQFCNLSTGACEEGCNDSDQCSEAQVCDAQNKCVDPCTPVGDYDSDRDQYCLADGLYYDACVNDACLTDENLCDMDTSAATFNGCVDPDLATNTCDAGDEFDDSRGEEGPIIWDVVYALSESTEGNRECSQSGAAPYTVTLSYIDPNGNGYGAMSSDAWRAYVWTEIGSNPTTSTNQLEFDASSDGSQGRATMVICFSTEPAELAVQIADEADNKSNIACASL